MKKGIASILTVSVIFALTACSLGGKTGDTNLFASNASEDPKKDEGNSSSQIDADSNNGNSSDMSGDAGDGSLLASDDNGAPVDVEEGETHKTTTWFREYVQKGKENSKSTRPYITVEFDQEHNYVKYYMEYMGTNVYMIVDNNSMVPIDGEYEIEYYGENVDSPPEFIPVYMTYTSSQIMIYRWDESKQAFDYDNPLEFNFKREYEL